MKIQALYHGYREGDIVKINHSNTFGMVMHVGDSTVHSTTFDIRPLNISKYWLIRKIQLWAIKKAFK